MQETTIIEINGAKLEEAKQKRQFSISNFGRYFANVWEVA